MSSLLHICKVCHYCYRAGKEFKFNEHPDNAAIITKDSSAPATEMDGLPPPKESSAV